MKALSTCLIVLMAGAGVAQDNSGLDELTTREDLRGWEPVGRVDIDNGGFCTGALIAADLVLTAAHCVIDASGAPIDAGRITFRAGFSYGTALAESPIARTIVDAGYRNVDPAPVAVIQRDVALLQLAQPIPSSVISPFVVALPGRGDEVSVVSYAEGREEALSWQRVCKVLEKRNDLIAVDCDVTFGASGAPVLDRSGYRPKIVSIISAGGEYEGQEVAFGMELPVLVDRLKSALRRGDATSVAVAETAAEDKAVPGKPGSPGKRITVGSGGDAGGDTGAKFLKP